MGTPCSISSQIAAGKEMPMNIRKPIDYNEMYIAFIDSYIRCQSMP